LQTETVNNMTSQALTISAEQTAMPPGFLARFLMFTVVSSITIGMGKLVTTLFAVQIGASPTQVGLIASTEWLGMLIVTLPAGFVIARFGARRVYFAATMGPMLISLLLPFTNVWYLLAAGRGGAGFCYPFRIVSMNSSFWEFLTRIGHHKAGWYRASGAIGTALLAPLLGNWVITAGGVFGAYWVIAALFAGIALYSWTLLPERPVVQANHAEAGSPSIGSQIRAIAGDPRISECCLVEMIDSATLALVSTFLIVLAMQVLHFSQHEAVNLLMAQGAMSITMLLVFGRLAARLKRRTAYMISLTGAALGLILLGCGEGFAAIAVGVVLVSGSEALVHLVNVNELSRHPGTKSKISGIYGLAQMLGAFAGSLLGSFLSHYFGLRMVFLIWLPLLLVAGVLIYVRARRTGKLSPG